MRKFGEVMSWEIAQTLHIFSNILSDLSAFESIEDVLTQEKFQSVLILARGT